MVCRLILEASRNSSRQKLACLWKRGCVHKGLAFADALALARLKAAPCPTLGRVCCGAALLLKLWLQAAKAQTTNHVCVFDSSEPWPSCHTCAACCAHAVLHPCCALLCVPLAICEHLAERLKASPRRLPLAAPAAERPRRPPSVAWRNSHPRFTLLRLPMSRHGEIASKAGGPGGSLRYVGGRGPLRSL